MKKTTLHIKGTHCASCKALIEDIAKDLPGVVSCTVDFQTGKTVLEHDEALDWQTFKKEVESLGKYTVELSRSDAGFSSGEAIFALIILASIGLMIGWIFWSKEKSISRTNREVALTCTTDMATEFHIHPHLEIMINGAKQEIQPNIGIRPGCMNSLHTHDASGVIHVESPEKRDFNLADFFAVWQKSFSKEQIFDLRVDDRHVIRETVNGKEVQDYENTILRDKDEIVISYEEKK